MAKREQKSNREKRKPKAEKPVKAPQSSATKAPVFGSGGKPGTGRKS